MAKIQHLFYFVLLIGIFVLFRVVMKMKLKINHKEIGRPQMGNNSRVASVPNSTLPNSKNIAPILILWWSKFFGTQLFCKPTSKICNDTPNLKHCSVPCEVTSDRNRADNASVMIIHARDPSPLPPAKYNHIPLALYTEENPVYSPMLNNAKFVAKFTYLMSYRVDLSDFFKPIFGYPTVKPLPIPFANKTGLVAAAFSNCETARTAYLRELMKHIQVDSYGACLRNKKGVPGRYQGDFKQAKTKLFRNYKFTIVFLNQDCAYFVDDQLTHALNAGTVPVFMGTDKVDELLGGNLKNAIIRVRDFASPKKLADYLLTVSKNETLYNKYLKWKYEGLQFPKSFLATPQGRAFQMRSYQYCIACETIAASRQTRKFKKKGLVKPEYCRPRKIEDWIKESTKNKKL